MSKSGIGARLNRFHRRAMAKLFGNELPPEEPTEEDLNPYSRRDALKIAASGLSLGAVGKAALMAAGTITLGAGWQSCFHNGGKVIIVGGGLAGLNCAMDLAEMCTDETGHLNIEVWEASDHFGGRADTRTTTAPDGKSFISDFGGMFADKYHNKFLYICDRFGLQLVDRREANEVAGLNDTWTWVHPDTGLLTEIPLSVLEEQYWAFVPTIEAELAAVSDPGPLGDYPYYCEISNRPDGLGGWFDEKINPAHREYKSVVKDWMSLEFAIPVYNQDGGNYLYYGLDPYATFGEGFLLSGYADVRWMLTGGMQVMVDAIKAAGEATGDVTYKTGYKLVAVCDAPVGDGYVLEFAPTNGVGPHKYRACDFFVNAIPFPRNNDVDYSGVAGFEESGKSALWDPETGVGVGSGGKVIFGQEGRPHHAVGRSGEYCGDGDGSGNGMEDWDTGHERRAEDPSNDNELDQITVFVGPEKALELEAVTSDAFAATHINAKREQFYPGFIAATRVTAKSDWMNNPLFKIIYSAYEIGGLCNHWGLEGLPFGDRMHFCGEATAKVWQAWMNGALITGSLTAARIRDIIEGVVQDSGDTGGLDSGDTGFAFLRDSEKEFDLYLETAFIPQPQWRGYYKGPDLPRHALIQRRRYFQGMNRMLELGPSFSKWWNEGAQNIVA